ncbi:hypothetical protein MGMO_43c00020 [Methyloglobulus morosus KoM1]|uniref:Uncharacterized protein n=1 Tax=Methyloglobulus morosus KoM1 TaxID=1116472 RepID=V5C832_9GAMM|nr:hypothetical protein [Methyloglobulus morosus]ESS72893.1 hypothetical protein MGMO_43c00020 [Methyloglobulus morosus KoM1]
MTTLTLTFPQKRNALVAIVAIVAIAGIIYIGFTHEPLSKEDDITEFERYALASLNKPPDKPEPSKRKPSTGKPKGEATSGVIAKNETASVNHGNYGDKGNKNPCTPNEEIIIFKKAIDENIEQLKIKKVLLKIPIPSFKCIPKAGKKLLYITLSGLPSNIVAYEMICRLKNDPNCSIMATTIPNPKPTSVQNKDQEDKEAKAKNDCLALIKNIPQLKNIGIELKEKLNGSFKFEWSNKNKLLATCVVESDKSKYLSIEN